ncbi:hypothetical protein [Lactococcus garvieae]
MSYNIWFAWWTPSSILIFDFNKRKIRNMKKIFTFSSILVLVNVAIIVFSPLLVQLLAMILPSGSENGFGDIIIVLMVPAIFSLIVTVPFFIIMLVANFLYNSKGDG